MKISGEKKLITVLASTKQPCELHGSKTQELTTDLVTRKKSTEAKLKEAFRLKLLELWKTRTNKASPDLFNFYVVYAGHDEITDGVRATKCRVNFRRRITTTKCPKNEEPLENMGFKGKTI